MTGTYTLELQDAGGQVLVSDTFGVWITDEGSGADRNTALPADPPATRLANATAPTVTWTAPNGGRVLSGTVDLPGTSLA